MCIFVVGCFDVSAVLDRLDLDGDDEGVLSEEVLASAFQRHGAGAIGPRSMYCWMPGLMCCRMRLISSGGGGS